MDVVDLNAPGITGLIEDLDQAQLLTEPAAPAAEPVARTDLRQALRTFLLPEAAEDLSRRN